MKTATDVLVFLSFVAGLLPAVLLLYFYGLRTAWNTSVAGRAVFYLIAVTAASYSLSVLTLAFPHFFHDEVGQWFRIVSRTLIAGVLWNLLRLFFRAQGFGRRRSEQTDHTDRNQI
jgi:hypothetical protein